MQEVENILRIFKEAKVAIKECNGTKLNNLSDQTINTASRTQDSDNIATAVIIYALSKIATKKSSDGVECETLYLKLSAQIDKLIKAIEQKKDFLVKKNLKEMRKEIATASHDLKDYIGDVFRKASINKASRIYEHGISAEKTAQLLGITIWELQNYVGDSPISEAPEARTIETKDRIKFTEDIFNG